MRTNNSGHQPWIFIRRTDVEAEALILWLPDAKSWLIWKVPDAGKDWGQEEKGMTEDEMASLTRWTWVWVDSGSWWWTGRPGVLRFMGSQRVGHDWVTEEQQRGSDSISVIKGAIGMEKMTIRWWESLNGEERGREKGVFRSPGTTSTFVTRVASLTPDCTLHLPSLQQVERR